MARAKLSGAPCNLPRDRLDIGGKIREEGVHRTHGVSVASRRADQALGVCRGRNRQRIPRIEDPPQRRTPRVMMRIRRVQDADDDPRIENGQRHSSRSSSSSPG